MKIRIIAVCLLACALLSSCNKDDDNSPGVISTTTVTTTMSSGNWRVTYFWDSDHEETSNFTGYNFTFNNAGPVVAIKSASTVTGTWNTGNDNSKTKLVINFAGNGDFSELNEDWEVTERTDSRIKLQHISGGGGGTDFLTFEKN